MIFSEKLKIKFIDMWDVMADILLIKSEKKNSVPNNRMPIIGNPCSIFQEIFKSQLNSIARKNLLSFLSF